jgi:hypothetical protein
MSGKPKERTERFKRQQPIDPALLRLLTLNKKPKHSLNPDKPTTRMEAKK